MEHVRKKFSKGTAFLLALGMLFSTCTPLIAFAVEHSVNGKDGITVTKLSDLSEEIQSTQWFKSECERGIYTDENASQVTLSYLGEVIDDIIIMARTVKGFDLQKFLAQSGYNYTLEDLEKFRAEGIKTLEDAKARETGSQYIQPRTDTDPEGLSSSDSGFDGIPDDIRYAKWFNVALEQGYYQDLASPYADAETKRQVGRKYMGEDVELIIHISDYVEGFDAKSFFEGTEFEGYTLDDVIAAQKSGFTFLSEYKEQQPKPVILKRGLFRSGGGLQVNDYQWGTIYVGSHASFNRNTSYQGNPKNPNIVDHATSHWIDGRGLSGASSDVSTFVTLFNTTLSGFEEEFEILNGKGTSAYSTDINNYIRCSWRGKATPEYRTSSIKATVTAVDGDVVTFKLEGTDFGGNQTVGGFVTSVQDTTHWVQINGMKRNEHYTDKTGTSLDGARYKIYEKKADGTPGRELTDFYVDGKPYLETQGIDFGGGNGVEHGFFRSRKWEFNDDATYNMLMRGVCAIEIKSPNGHINYFGENPDINTQYLHMPVNIDGKTWWGVWDDSIDLTEDDPSDIADSFGWVVQNSTMLMMNPRETFVELEKKSSSPACTATNPNYSLEGAVYGVYEDLACTKFATDYTTYPFKEAKLITDANGKTNKVRLQYTENIKYYVKEISHSKGFALDTTVYHVTPTWKNTYKLSVLEEPKGDPVKVFLTKKDRDTGLNKPEGDGTLGGAQYMFKFYELDPTTSLLGEANQTALQQRWNQSAKWTFIATTNDNGIGEIPEDQLPITGYYQGDAVRGLPIGIMYCREIKAPEGYLINDTIYEAEITDDWGNDQVIPTFNLPVTPEEPKRSGLKIRKVDWEHTSEQGDTTLAGAQYQVINKSKNSVWVGEDLNNLREVPVNGVCTTLTTDAQGNASTGKVFFPYGTYQIKEVKAPTGYLLDSNVYEFKVAENNLTIASFDVIQATNGTIQLGRKTDVLPDKPIRGGVKIQKVDNDDMKNHAQGDATLQGATYDIINSSKEEIVLKQNNTNKVIAKGAVCLTLTTDENGFATTANDVLPYGTYTIKETKPSTGYLVDKNIYSFAIRQDGTVVGSQNVLASPDGTLQLGVSTDKFPEPVIRGGVKIQKVDYNDNTSNAQGDATLQGATYDVINRSNEYVYVNINNSLKKVDKGAVCLTLTTNENGFAQVPENTLPYGTYEIVETKPSTGYLLDKNVYRFSVRKDGTVVGEQTTTVSPNGTLSVGKTTDKLPEEVIRGGLSITKVDRETMRNEPQGGATLKGATYDVINKSQSFVYVNTDEGLKKISVGEVCLTLTTDEKGQASTLTDALPYGTYELKETKPSKGYLLDQNTYGFKIREDGTVIKDVEVLSSPENVFPVGTITDKLPEEPIRGDLEFIKIDKYSKRLGNVPFKITSVTTGESHVIVTDVNGYASTASDWNPHTRDTNRGETPEDGIWFGEIDPDDNKGALLFDTYTIEEMPCEANGGLNLVKFNMLIERHKVTVKLGTLIDYNPLIITTAKEKVSGGKEASPFGEVTLVDTVIAEELIPGETYRTVGTLMDYETKAPILDKDGNEITVEKEFKARMSFEAVNVEFTFDPTGLNGKRTVIFEKLYDSNGRELAVHEDFEDEGQTIYFTPMEIKTSAIGELTKNKVVPATENAVIIDTVSYGGLEKGKEYRLFGTLMDKLEEVALKDKNGNEITAETTFIAEDTEGTVEVRFEFDATLLKGKTGVVFEDCYEGDKLVAVHADIEDDEQTIYFPEIGTTALDSELLSHVIPSTNTAVIVDVVTYKNLLVGESYRFVGKLMDPETKEVYRDTEGKEIVAETEVTPTKADGTVEVRFEFDATILKGKKGVVFEDCYQSDVVVASHADFEDEGQTVYFPDLHTTALGKDTGNRVVPISKEAVFIDIVRYTNLIQGNRYILIGTLMNPETNEAFTDAEGNVIKSTVDFIAEDTEGMVEVPFTVDATLLQGKKGVVFEDCYEDDRLIASHADITDAEQTVYFPEIRTSATDESLQSNVIYAGEKAVIVDTVFYKGLVPNVLHKMTGVIIDKESGEPFELEEGKFITAEAEFTPEQSEGTVEVRFEFDARVIKGKTGVVFENCYQNDVLIAVHRDINDINQTVYFPDMGTTATFKDGEKIAPTNKEVTLVDTIKYTNFPVGREIEFVGTLMNKSAKEVATNKDGKEITATQKVKIEEPNGEVQVEFTFDASEFDGEYVVFEKAFDVETGVMIASHEDIDDEGQTVKFINKEKTEVKTGFGQKNVIGLVLLFVGLAGVVGITLWVKSKKGHIIR